MAGFRSKILYLIGNHEIHDGQFNSATPDVHGFGAIYLSFLDGFQYRYALLWGKPEVNKFNRRCKNCVEKISTCRSRTSKVDSNRCPIGCCTDKSMELEKIENLFVQNTQILLVNSIATINPIALWESVLQYCKDCIPSPEIYKPPKIIRKIFSELGSFLL